MNNKHNECFNPDIAVPPADIILSILNEDDNDCIDQLLKFYMPYIRSAAATTVINYNGQREGIYISDDLVQEITLRIIHAMDILRIKLTEQKQISPNGSVIIILD